jgi:hypothetical protein
MAMSENSIPVHDPGGKVRLALQMESPAQPYLAVKPANTATA